MQATPVYLGIDIGTSGIRACCIDEDDKQIAEHHLAFDNDLTGKTQQDPNPWLQQLDQLLVAIKTQLSTKNSEYKINAISIDGTSSTLIACNKEGKALSPAMMYNDLQSQKQADLIRRFAPSNSAVHGASSSLAKALFLLDKYPETELLCHQADWLASSLTGHYGISDENNCLKLGYNSIKQCWPDWLFHNDENCIIAKSILPKVVTPGRAIAKVKPELIKKYALDEECTVIAGTTDSNAAVLATGANQIGDAVTSLGSTLVVKIFSDKPLFAPEYGIYSHRLNDHWLVGGASNSGGKTLLQYFSQQQLDEMTPKLNPEQPTGLNYYPLPANGERFPYNDNNKKNITSPRPKEDVIFFQGLLEGIANIEADAYKKLSELGTANPTKIFTAGGGAKNQAWRKIRERTTGVDITNAAQTEACFGSALLAKQGYKNIKHK